VSRPSRPESEAGEGADDGGKPTVPCGSLIDLHFHALPAIDDGPASLEDALALCAAAQAGATSVVVATPHINFEYPDVDAGVVRAGVEELRAALARANIAIDLRPGAEVALSRAVELSDDQLGQLTLGGGPTVLLEFPWRAAATGMAAAAQRVGARGFQLLIAHPERTPLLRDNPGLVRSLVEGGAWCCLNAGSLSEGAGRGTRRTARALLDAGLIHAIASDAHDLVGRRPDLASRLDDAGLSAEEIAYFTRDGPAAILEGIRPGPPPRQVSRRGIRLRWAGR
jgi:protein-tyrosine phosphatase